MNVKCNKMLNNKWEENGFFLLVAGEWIGRWVWGQIFFKKKVNGGKEMERIDSGGEGEKRNGWILGRRDESGGECKEEWKNGNRKLQRMECIKDAWKAKWKEERGRERRKSKEERLGDSFVKFSYQERSLSRLPCSKTALANCLKTRSM